VLRKCRTPLASICCGSVVQHAVTTSCTTNRNNVAYPTLHYFDLSWIYRADCCTVCCTTNPQLIESQQQVHNRSPQQVVEQTASLTTSWTTCRTASPPQIHIKLHATISKSYSKSHNLLYNKSTTNWSNGVRHWCNTTAIQEETLVLRLYCASVNTATAQQTRTATNNQGRRSIWDTPPNIWTGGTLSRMSPSIFLE